MAEVYRDSRGRYAREKSAVFKQSGDKHWVRLFGVWAELKPVTRESMQESLRQFEKAWQRAM